MDHKVFFQEDNMLNAVATISFLQKVEEAYPEKNRIHLFCDNARYYRNKAVTEYLADLIVEDQVIIEIKSIANIAPIHEAQLLSYLKLSDCKYGLLINFNVKLLKEGIRRFKA